MIRTPREWDEECRECHGSGIVHRRERFSLWTPDEHAPYGPTKLGDRCKGAEDAPRDAVICSAHAGSSIFEACKEGVTLARAYGRPVVFEFNETVVICRADGDPEAISKEWWKRAYGKTYEQSMRDR